MDPVLNPYSPGAGRPPAALAGREVQMESWLVALARHEADRGAQPVVLYGLRGVGKTVLLTSFARSAEERGWIVAQVEAGQSPGIRETIGEALHAPLAERARPGAGARLKTALRTALSFKASYDSTGSWNFGLGLGDPSSTPSSTGVLETDLTALVRDLAAGAAEGGGGLTILVDEAQDLSGEELSALCALAHVAGQRGWRFLLALAGLPSLPRVLTEARSYAERLFDYEVVERLDDEQARRALSDPAQAAGASWDDEALSLIADETKGYPYFLQQLGKDTWHAATSSPITVADARVGAAAGLAALDAGFFRSRWERATRSEQRYLRAMAGDGDAGSLSGALANRLGKRPGSLGPARAALIAKGLIYPREHGAVAFTVPGMAAFVLRQPHD